MIHGILAQAASPSDRIRGGGFSRQAPCKSQRLPAHLRAHAAVHQIVQLRIELLRVKPKVWRRLAVDTSVTLATLHSILQGAVGWQGKHMHEFVFGKRKYGIPYPDDLELEPDHEQHISLAMALGELNSFVYRYDFGDGWEHRVRVEKALDIPSRNHAFCLQGENACPPEDVGGPAGYDYFLRAVQDQAHAEHRAVKRWFGGVFDPAALSVESINAVLAGIPYR